MGVGTLSDMDPIIVSPTRQEYRGEAYYLCGRYFQRKGRRLHRAVWEDHYGPVPTGYHVHHRDHDRANNAVANLVLLPAAAHLSHHGGERTPARLAAYAAAIPRLKAGNARLTPEQRADAARRGWENVERVEVQCQECGETFTTPHPTRAKFCGGTCKARDLRRRRRQV